MVAFYSGTQQYDKALSMSEKIVAVLEKKLEPGDKNLVIGLENHAWLLRKLGRNEEAQLLSDRLSALGGSRNMRRSGDRVELK